MSRIIEAIAEKMNAEAAKEFKTAVEALGFHLLDNSKGEYVSRGKAEAELATAKKSLDDLTGKLEKLQAEAAGAVELEKKLKETVDAHKAEVAALKAGAEREKKTAQVKQALTQSGAWDADLAFTAMALDLDKLDYDDKGNLIGLSDRIKALQEDKTRLFDVRTPKGTYIPSKGASADNPWKRETFNLTEQGRIAREEPARAVALAAEAGITLSL